MSNNKSRAAIGLQESWASNISDYILLRRQQTHSAYKVIDATVNTDSKQVDKEESSHLFSALFIMLATYLEEGHTVLTIEIAENEKPLQGQINGELITLYAWQQQLLEMLATPILALIDAQIDTQQEDDSTIESSLFDSLDTIFGKRAQLWAQLALSNHEKEILVKRFDSVVALYQLLKNTEFAAFIELIYNHALFANVNADDANT